MNKRALVVGILVACALHLWMVWPLARPSRGPTSPDDAMPPIDSVAIREVDADQPEAKRPAEQAEPHSSREELRQAEQLAQDQPPQSSEQPVDTAVVEQADAAPVREVQLAQAAQHAELPPLPTAPAPTNVAADRAPQIESTTAVPDSGPAPLFDPIAARDAVVESAPGSDASMPSTEASTLPPAPSAVAALREPEPPPLPPPPAVQPPNIAATAPQPLPPLAEAVPPPAAPRTSPALRLRSREMQSWNRDDVLASLPKPDPAFLSATDPRQDRAQSQSSARATQAPAVQAAATPAIDIAPRAQVPYTPVKFNSLRDRRSDRRPASTHVELEGNAPATPMVQPQSAPRGAGAEAADRGYLKSLGPAPQEPVARIAWGDAPSAMKTLSTGRMALVIVNDDLKVVASIDGSSGAWARAGLPNQMATFSNRVRVVDHVSAFAAFARFCEPHEHLAVLVPIGLERRIEGAMDQAARAEGLSRRQVAACYGRLESRRGALEFVIDRVERRPIQ